MYKTTLTDVVSEYQSVMSKRSEEWDVNLRPRPKIDISNVEIITARSLEILGLDPDIDKFLRGLAPDIDTDTLTFHQMLDLLLKSLRDDIEQCLDDDQKHFLQSVHLKFLKTGFTNACCVNADPNGTPLGYYVAFLNEGLYFSLRQLFTALLFEELQGELASYRRDGQTAFEAAIRLYLEPETENIEPIPEYVGDLNASGEIGAHITSATSLLLQFISLHEFAHAWLGHHEIIEAQRLAMSAQVVDGSSPDISELSKELEYEADEFAFRALMSRTRSTESHWAHCFAVHLFFCYLAELENRLGRPLSDLHPLPLLRSERLCQILKKAFPYEAHGESDLFRIDRLVKKWTTRNVSTP